MRRSAVGLMFAVLLGACSTLVGADFDGLELAAGGEAGSTGGDAGGGEAGQSAGTSGEGGATGGEAGASGAGGEPSAGAGGEPAGGEGGAAGDGGAAGQAGEGGSAGAGGASGAAGMPGCGNAAGGANGDGSVVLNEIKGQGSGDDFIELYNPGPAELDLTGYGVSDGSNTLVFPFGTSLEACSFLLILLGQQEAGGGFTCFTPSPCFHATWGVSAGGEVIVLRDAASTVIDSATYPDEDLMIVVDGQTWGRLPDGTGAFQATLPTPEAPNAEE